MYKLLDSEINQVSGCCCNCDCGEGQERVRALMISCYYWKKDKSLVIDGSSTLCPLSYGDATSKTNPDIQIIEETYDRMFYGVTLDVRIKK